MTYRLLRTPLKVLRAGRDFSQEDVAQKVGMKPTRYWWLETKGGIATKDEVKAIAKVFRVAPKDIAIAERTEVVRVEMSA